MFKSMDGGSTWTPKTKGLPTDAGIYTIDYTITWPGLRLNLYVGLWRHDGLYESNDGAETWQSMQQDSYSQTYTLAANHQPSAKPAIYAAAFDSAGEKNLTFNRLLALDYGSGTWKTVPINQPWHVDKNAFSGMAMGVAPSGAIYIQILGVHQSTDQGATWHDIGGTPQPHVDAHAWAFYEGSAYVGNDGGIWRYWPFSAADETQGQWISLNRFELQTHLCNSVSLLPRNPGIMLSGCQDNGTILRLHGIWARVLGGDGGIVRWEPSAMRDTAYRTNSPAGGPVLLRSDDGGQTWPHDISLERFPDKLVQGDGHTDDVQIAVNPVHPERLLMGYSAVYESPDRGDTWTAISGLLEGGDWVSALAYLGTDKYAGFSNGQLWRRYDGNPWSRVVPPTGSNWGGVITGIAIDVDRTAFIYNVYLTVSGDNGDTGRVWRSVDGGQTFSEITGNLASIGINTIAVYKDQFLWLFVGTNVGVFAAPDQDAPPCWMRFGQTQPMPDVRVMDLAVETRNRTLTAATYGRGIFVTGLDSLGVPVVPAIHIEFQEAAHPVAGQKGHFSLKMEGVVEVVPLKYYWAMWVGSNWFGKGFLPDFVRTIPETTELVTVRAKVNMDGCELADSISFYPVP